MDVAATRQHCATAQFTGGYRTLAPEAALTTRHSYQITIQRVVLFTGQINDTQAIQDRRDHQEASRSGGPVSQGSDRLDSSDRLDGGDRKDIVKRDSALEEPGSTSKCVHFL